MHVSPVKAGTYFGPYDETTCIDWTDDSRCFVVGSRDMSTWVFGAERWDNLIYYALGGHKDAIVGCFFEANSLDLYTLSQDGALCVWQCDTPPEGLRLKAPRGWKADILRREEEEEEEEEEGGTRETTIRGKAAPAEEERKGKVQYSRLAKYFFNKEGEFNELPVYSSKAEKIMPGLRPDQQQLDDDGALPRLIVLLVVMTSARGWTPSSASPAAAFPLCKMAFRVSEMHPSQLTAPTLTLQRGTACSPGEQPHAQHT
ncbi:periodic tryptophan protein 2 homolog [Tamandua tetradactyla]|uniref:periodic tryptophan protein 2 homolog n=1 Tax=Tamandua tetradactyla TaxID=48850 RepID=UPI0040539091